MVLRIVVGALFAGHGAQKLFGFFGGHGVNATGGFFESLGLRPGGIMALAAGLAELAGGALFALGLLAAALMIAVMVTAIATVHWHSGVWVTNGGFEYNLVLAIVAFSGFLTKVDDPFNGAFELKLWFSRTNQIAKARRAIRPRPRSAFWRTRTADPAAQSHAAQLPPSRKGVDMASWVA